jgi:pimeloyl-ACP methyl ester carboxylesterase
LAVGERRFVRSVGLAFDRVSAGAVRSRATIEQLIFLPGAAGKTEVWEPVARGLSHAGRRQFVSWPGFGGAPVDETVTGLDGLVRRVTAEIAAPTVLFGQSMGGLIALRACLAAPALVRGLVLSVTSGGIDVAALGATDWRPEFERDNPGLPRWFLDASDDMSEALQHVAVPTLLLWGDADAISPVAVGRRLAQLLPNAELVIIRGGGHDLVNTHAPELLPHIERHLERN